MNIGDIVTIGEQSDARLDFLCRGYVGQIAAIDGDSAFVETDKVKVQSVSFKQWLPISTLEKQLEDGEVDEILKKADCGTEIVERVRQRYQEKQVADLILKDPDGNDLEIVSPLEVKDGKSVFEVGNFKTKERYLVTIEVTEL